jgi:hypothetical protein
MYVMPEDVMAATGYTDVTTQQVLQAQFIIEIYTCDDVVVLDHLFRLYGPDGQELLEHGVWQIDNIAPYINIWGYREGYKARIQQFGVDG